MRLLVLANGAEGIVVGYCPDSSGSPQAILIRADGSMDYVPVRDMKLVAASKKLAQSIEELDTFVAPPLESRN